MATKKSMSVAELKALKKGDVVVIVASGSGHNYTIGATYKVRHTAADNGGSNIVCETIDGSWIGNNLSAAHVARGWSTREEEATYLEESVAVITKEIKEMKKRAEFLRKYKDDKDELAHLIADAFKTDGSVEAIRAILDKSMMLADKS